MDSQEEERLSITPLSTYRDVGLSRYCLDQNRHQTQIAIPVSEVPLPTPDLTCRMHEAEQIIMVSHEIIRCDLRDLSI